MDETKLRDLSMPTASANSWWLRQKDNRFNRWNVSSTGELSANPENAAHRIYADYAVLNVPKLDRSFAHNDPVFAMGSCFAREIESALMARGHNVVSMDKKAIDRPEFMTPEHPVKGHGPRTGFFHRYTPSSMLQEFRQSFDEIPGWTDTSLLSRYGDDILDLNYSHLPGIDTSIEATATRRRVARELVQQSVRARMVVLTLGYVEAWLHRPSGLWANTVHPKLFRQHPDEFEFRLLSIEDVVGTLEGIHDLLSRRSETGDFTIFVTVSPVPLAMTFTGDDIVVANAASKAILRVAAGAFAAAHDNVVYFPSYEMVTHSRQDLAWRADRLHVTREMVDRIVATFQASYFADQGEPDRSESPSSGYRSSATSSHST